MLADGIGDAFRFDFAGAAVNVGLLLVLWRVEVNVVQLRMSRLAVLMSRFRLPMLVWIPFFSIWQAAAPMWTVGIWSIPCRA